MTEKFNSAKSPDSNDGSISVKPGEHLSIAYQRGVTFDLTTVKGEGSAWIGDDNVVGLEPGKTITGIPSCELRANEGSALEVQIKVQK